MSAVRNFVSVLGVLVIAACTNSTSAKNFTYGKGQPGYGLPEGGEIRHERVNLLGMPPQTWLMVYQYRGPAGETQAQALAGTAPFPAPAMGGKGQYGNCVDERTDATWPFSPVSGAGQMYLQLPSGKPTVTGAGITGSLDVVETNPPNKSGNSTFRAYDFTYGGGAPGVTDPTKPNFNATMTTAAMSTPDTDYIVDIGQGPMMYHMPAAYTTPLGIGGAATVNIPAGKDLEFTWTPPAQDMGADGHTHTYKTHFNFTFFADPTSSNPPQFICFPDVDGHQLIPAAVINALPSGGLIVNADLSHYLDAADAGGEMRRFDLVSIFCNISLYKIQ